jgi:Ca2+-binding RTX toxin-like protein
MPAVPNTWLNDFVTNLKTTGTQGDPVITILASGHILVVWSDFDDTGVGSPASTDIVGRIFDSQGNAVTDDIRLNTRNSADTEFDVSVTALSNGGFAITYDESGSFTDVNVETYSFNPATETISFVSSADLFFDAGDANPFGTVIASTSSTTALAAYTQSNADGSETVFVRSYNPTTNALGAPTTVFSGASGAGEDIGAPSIAALTSGNFAVAFANRNNGAANDSVELYIRNSAGGAVTSITVASGLEASDVSVAAINTGHIVVAYNNLANSGDITYRVFTNAGVALTSGGPFTDGGGPNSQNEQAVIGLADGTFVIVWDDDTTGQIIGQRYSISGQSVFALTGNFVVDDTGGTGISEIELAAFADGRFAVTWSANGDIRTKIMDTRDFVNSTAVYTFQNQQVGTIGNDVFTTDDDADLVHGHDGNDVITDNGLSEDNEYFGDLGNDTLIVTTVIGGDSWNGGSGNDTIDWSVSGPVGATFDMAAGLATAGGQDEVMTSFENLIATNNADIIFGTGGENTITALDGNDTIEGGFSTDSIDAGAGNDIMTVRDGQFADNVNGGTGTDHYNFAYLNQRIVINLGAGTLQVFDSSGVAFGPALTVSGIENVSGGSLNDSIIGDGAANILQGRSGNDALSGAAGVDELRGGNGSDTLNGGADGDRLYGGLGADQHIGGDGPGVDYARYDDADYGNLVISLANPAANTGAAAGDTYTGIEGVFSGVGNDDIFGNGARNFLYGGGGNDLIRGNAGNDYLVGGAGGDGLYGGVGADQHIGGDGAGVDYARYDDANHGNLVISLANPAANTGAAAGDTYTGIEGIIGGVGNDNITGDAARNFLHGGDGNDSLRGANGNDYLNGGDGNDQLSGGVGADQHLGGAGFDYARYDDANHGNLIINLGDSSLNTGAASGDTYSGIEGIVGGAGIDTITGNNASNTLYGLGGTDRLDGKLGNDTLIGGSGERDDYRFTTTLGLGNFDTVMGFEHDLDKIVLSRAVFDDIGATVDASEFGTVGGANVFIIFNQSNGRLFYDEGGNDAGADKILFAILGPGVTIDAGDFLTIA